MKKVGIRKLICTYLAIIMASCIMTLNIEASNDDTQYYESVAELVNENWKDDYVGVIRLTIGDPVMNVDGNEEEIDEGRSTSPIIKNDRTLLPVRAVVEILGGNISYDNSDRSVTIDTDETTIEMQIENNEMFINGNRIVTDVAPVIENDRTFLPIRALTENLNCDVEWDQDSKTVSIYNTYQTKRIVVKTNSDIDFNAYAPDTILSGSDGEYVLQFSTIEAARDCCEDLNSKSNVDYAEADGFIPFDEPEESHEQVSSGDHNSWGVEKIGADKFANALGRTKSKTSAVVAVVDTGVDSSHSFLKNRIASKGYDFVNGDSDPSDDNGHGTHVAGTIVDCTPDLNVKILPVKVLNSNGSGTNLMVSTGIKYATDKNADVINLSLGGPANNTVNNALSYAIRNGSVVVAAAGNDKANTKNYSPADYYDAIVVSATDSDDDIAYFSNYGDTVDVCAPGVRIRSCVPGGSYKSLSGTSMAAPHASAVAAMFKIYDSSMSPAQIETAVRKYVDDLGVKRWDRIYGTGRINVSEVIESPTDETPTENEIVSYTWSVGNLSLEVGESQRIKLYANYGDGSKKDVTSSCELYSNDMSIATVSSTGRITGKSEGSVTVYFDKAVASSVTMPRPLNVEVKENSRSTPTPIPPTPTPVPEEDKIISYSWSDSEITIEAGEYKNIKLYANYKSGIKKDVTSVSNLYSDDINVATISSSGQVKGIGSGNTTVYFDKAVGSGVTMPKPLKVTVSQAHSSNMLRIEWSVGNVELNVGETSSITLYAVYDGGHKEDITKECGLYSMDESIAKVTSSGKISGIKKGTTQIWIDSIPQAGIDLPRFLNVNVK